MLTIASMVKRSMTSGDSKRSNSWPK